MFGEKCLGEFLDPHEGLCLHIKFGERSYAGPSAWNSLRHHIREITDTIRFRRQLKTVLFQRALLDS